MAIMVKFGLTIVACASLAHASCPYMDGSVGASPHAAPVRRDGDKQAPSAATEEFMAKYEVDDTDVYLTNNFGGPIEDQESLSAGERGPTLLEDFIFREKITHFGTCMFLLQNLALT
jgi:catalase